MVARPIVHKTHDLVRWSAEARNLRVGGDLAKPAGDEGDSERREAVHWEGHAGNVVDGPRRNDLGPRARVEFVLLVDTAVVFACFGGVGFELEGFC